MIIFAASYHTWDYMEKFIGRNREINEIERCYNSDRSEFVVISGRRRIGKTFLVSNALKGRITLSYVGSHKPYSKTKYAMLCLNSAHGTMRLTLLKHYCQNLMYLGKKCFSLMKCRGSTRLAVNLSLP